MQKRYTLSVAGLLVVLALALTACGGAGPTSTPTPSNTPEPSSTPAATNTPVPTLDPAFLGMEDLQGTATALATELALAQSRAQGASSAGEENAAELDIHRIEGEIDVIEELMASGGAEAETEDMATEETAAEESDAEAMAVTLSLGGDFAEARDWTWDELSALDMITATVAGPREDSPEAEYTGVSLMALLEAAEAGEDATALVATASDEFAAEIDLALAKECADCMIVLTDDATLRLIMPGFPSNNWVSDVISLVAQ